MTGRILFCAILCVTVCSALPAAAKPSVFLNGVNIDGVTNQKFDNCTVVLDAEGNILITAKGYEVQTVTPTEKTPPPTTQKVPVSRRYFLVSETNLPGMAQYDIDVFVNSVWVKRISHNDPQNVLEITKHFHQGKNTVHLTATKTMADGRRSASSQHYLKIIIGEGNIGGNNVMIDNPLIEFRVDASQMQNQSKEFRVKGR